MHQEKTVPSIIILFGYNQHCRAQIQKGKLVSLVIHIEKSDCFFSYLKEIALIILSCKINRNYIMIELFACILNGLLFGDYS